MIWNAKSSQRVVRELVEWDGREHPKSDPFLFQGRVLAVPVPLSLATEIALKAWQCRERKGAPDHGHEVIRWLGGGRAKAA